MINLLKSKITSPARRRGPERKPGMKEYDVIIVGSGSGANLIEDALEHNKTVALVDKGPAGGTCLNVG